MLSNTDKIALSNLDSEYLVIKGNIYSNNKEYDKAREYYNLAVALSNTDALAKLGELYIIEKNIELGIEYLKLASNEDNVLALYLLGHLYYNNKKYKDLELGHYYFSKAMEIVSASDEEEKIKYPDLHFEVAQDIINNSNNFDSLLQAYNLLLTAFDGYSYSIDNGNIDSSNKLKKVKTLLDNKMFNEVKELFNHDECDEECHCNH